MRKALRLLFTITIWIVCLIIFPFSLMAAFFIPVHAASGVVLFLFLLFGVPALTGKKIRPSLQFAALAAEALMVLAVLAYYTADRRSSECNFKPDDSVAPLLSFSQCKSLYNGSREEKACLGVVDNPYDLAFFNGGLLVVGGRDYSTLGRLDPHKPGVFSAEPLGFGNLQKVVVDETRRRAVFTMWKDRKILLYDLDKSVPIKAFRTNVSKLIGAEKLGDKIYIISELAQLYVVDLKNDTVRLHDLGYRFHTLNGMKIDPERKIIYLSDWVWGNIYKFDIRRMKTVRRATPGMVSTGIAVDPKSREVFVARMLASKIDVFDGDTLALKRSIPAGFGVNDVALSADGTKIHAVRYFAGKFETIDRASGEKLAEHHIGGATRALLYSPENNRIFAASKCGVFEISPGD